MSAWTREDDAPAAERLEMGPTDELGPRSLGDDDDDLEPLGREWMEALIEACRKGLAASGPE